MPQKLLLIQMLELQKAHKMQLMLTRKRKMKKRLKQMVRRKRKKRKKRKKKQRLKKRKKLLCKSEKIQLKFHKLEDHQVPQLDLMLLLFPTLLVNHMLTSIMLKSQREVSNINQLFFHQVSMDHHKRSQSLTQICNTELTWEDKEFRLLMPTLIKLLPLV